MTKVFEKPAIFPVTLWQKYLLDQMLHPDCPLDLQDRSILPNVFQMRPAIDIRRLRRAVDKLRRRHDSLRIRFDRVNEVWRAVIHPPGEDIVRVVDLPAMENDVFHAEISALANAHMPLIDASLAEIIVVRCPNRADVLITRVHHVITDGYGMVVLTEDLAKLLIGLPIFGKAVSHADYLARFERPAPQNAARIAAFWETLHRDLAPTPNVGRKAKGLEPLYHGFGEADQKLLICNVSQDSLHHFSDRVAKTKPSVATTFFAGYLEAMCQCYDLEKMVVMAHVSRTDPAMDSYIGDHTLDPVLPYVAGGKKGFEQAARTLGGRIVEAMDHLPSEAARRGTPYEAGLVERGIFPGQFSIYEPRATTRQSRSAFSSGFSAGYGQEQKIGPYSITMLDVSIRRRKVAEIEFDLGAAQIRTGFLLHFDGVAYADGEMRKIGDTICDLLDLELTEAVIS